MTKGGAETNQCARCIFNKKDSVERNQQSDNKINTDKQKIYKNRIIMRNRPRRGQTKTAGAFMHDLYAGTRPETRFILEVGGVTKTFWKWEIFKEGVRQIKPP